ncbi:Uncharacterised protein [uncultured archaeon]|nr:Uncharacterised protein [uncultured archaeon]
MDIVKQGDFVMTKGPSPNIGFCTKNDIDTIYHHWITVHWLGTLESSTIPMDFVRKISKEQAMAYLIRI